MNKSRKRIVLFTLLLAVIILMMIGVWQMNTKSETALTSKVYNGHGGTMKNTLAEIDTPDPSIVYKDGYYYMTFTHHGSDIMIMKSRTLDFHGAERKVVWYPPVDTMYSANLWAPEIQFLQGKWYIYFAADDGSNENHRMYVLEGDTDDPMDSYTFKGQVTDDTNKWAIDGLVLEHEDKLYFVWSGWEGDTNIQQNTYIAPMSKPDTISGPRVLLNEPDLDWERAGGPPFINEGQAILKKNGRVFIAYSGAGSWTPFYSIGLLSLEAGADPLDAANWTKSEQPLMAMDADAGVYGPGHNTFVSSPDGLEDWIVYHGTTSEFDGWNNRKARAQRVTWNEAGKPLFGKPLSLSTAIPVPSGTGVFLAEHAVNVNGELRFDNIPAAVNTQASMLLHYKNDTMEPIPIQVGVNDGAAVTTELPPTKQNEAGYIYIRIPLQAGQNAIKLNADNVQSTIIAMEIIRYEAENAQIANDGEVQDNPFASNGRSALIQQGGAEEIRFDNIRVPQSGTYTVHIAAANGSEQVQELELIVNGGRKYKIKIAPGERNKFEEVTVSVELKAEGNTFVVGKATGLIELDYIDISAVTN
ncbi:GH43 family beta-xylosidase [Paenibacillus castaneae]|uniref:family 43 glycosylhydrolase n=1 Tax=Paenibacillus castaneae TaxID=474957 RepID=UPI000C9BFD23|nr:family 43 glycosylhydrolase [Paenibacillus castaneae]NIK77171.1 GH43 family beta-xylosidase [Paenibacillus castaneae]